MAIEYNVTTRTRAIVHSPCVATNFAARTDSVVYLWICDCLEFSVSLVRHAVGLTTRTDCRELVKVKLIEGVLARNVV
jgi:hypothetical protein